jgi:hypothetical protein
MPAVVWQPHWQNILPLASFDGGIAKLMAAVPTNAARTKNGETETIAAGIHRANTFIVILLCCWSDDYRNLIGPIIVPGVAVRESTAYATTKHDLSNMLSTHNSIWPVDARYCSAPPLVFLAGLSVPH